MRAYSTGVRRDSFFEQKIMRLNLGFGAVPLSNQKTMRLGISCVDGEITAIVKSLKETLLVFLWINAVTLPYKTVTFGTDFKCRYKEATQKIT